MVGGSNINLDTVRLKKNMWLTSIGAQEAPETSNVFWLVKQKLPVKLEVGGIYSEL